uniref:olfactory receptor 7A40-like n=1 Tax=Callospermophilus lateralis TaxID=76772 RepID=UPI00403891EC
MHMEARNDTQLLEFLLLGLAKDPDLQPLIFGLFLSMYLVTVLGNLLIILATISDSHLHMPMYFFLSNLSFVDICFTSTAIPKMLVNIQTQSKAITYVGSITQIHFFVLVAGLDIFMLTVMAYDWIVAICHPLNYIVIMNCRICGLLVLVSWVVSVLYALLQSLMMLRLSFCTDLEIPHFFSDLNQLLQRACSDNILNEVVIYFAAVLLGGGPLTGILYSYCQIVSSIRAISSAQTVMTCDRFVAVCHPLHYMVIMKHMLCGLLVLVSWFVSFLDALFQSLLVLQLSFCTDLEIPHFFRELNQVVQRACSDTFLNEVVIYFAALLLAGGLLIGIHYSYCKIMSSISAISSAQGKYKAFSTCASHLSVVSLFYGTILGVYLSSAVTQNSHSTATASLMYTVVTLMLNPFIYSLRNKDIKSALRRL